MDRRQLCGQYDAFGQYTFIDYSTDVQRRCGEVLLFVDRARKHQSKKVQECLEKKDRIRITYLLKGSPEFNAVEECWRWGKYDLLVSRYYLQFADLKSTMTEYYKTRRFNLEVIRYLLRCP